MDFITHELLMLAIEARCPGIIHGVEYWVCHPLDENGQHCGDAEIAAWSPTCRWKLEDLPNMSILRQEAESMRPILAAKHARAVRREKLAACDWTQNAEFPADFRAKWAKYRQELRDITESEGWPLNIIWPKEPQ
jgi:hypothetical protein